MKNYIRDILGDRVSKPDLGMDKHPDLKWDTLDTIGRLAQQHPIRIAGGTVMELGPGKTPDMMIAMGIAGAVRVYGRDVQNRMPADWQSADRRMVVSGEILRGAAPEFVKALPDGLVEASRVAGDCIEVSAYDGIHLGETEGSIDFIFSKSVLEHVGRAATPAILAEHFRVLAPGGFALHIIDLRDHLHIDGDYTERGDWLDALRYPEWLHDAMTSNRPAYINRIRAGAWRRLFETAGFEIANWRLRHLDLPEGFAGRTSVHPTLWDSAEDYSAGWVEVLARRPAQA